MCGANHEPSGRTQQLLNGGIKFLAMPSPGASVYMIIDGNIPFRCVLWWCHCDTEMTEVTPSCPNVSACSLLSLLPQQPHPSWLYFYNCLWPWPWLKHWYVVFGRYRWADVARQLYISNVPHPETSVILVLSFKTLYPWAQALRWFEYTWLRDYDF